jgi:methylmalonic aciduria homocystinuria type C protein
MASAWSARTAALRAALEAQGLDIVAPLNLRWYNEVAPETARIAPTADGAGEDALAVLVGNSRALWPAFTAAHDSDPAIGDAEHPVDTFVAHAIRAAIADASSSRGGSTGSTGRCDVRDRSRVFDSHDTSPGKLVAIQRMAHVAGVAHLDEKCHLSIHPKHGPWIALRTVLVFDDIEGPDEADRQTTPPNPLATNGAARARVDDAFAYALEGYTDPKKARRGGVGGSPCATPFSLTPKTIRKNTRSGTTMSRFFTTTTARREATRDDAYGTVCARTKAKADDDV